MSWVFLFGTGKAFVEVLDLIQINTTNATHEEG